jgi:Domain of unknown function (DUF4440)
MRLIWILLIPALLVQACESQPDQLDPARQKAVNSAVESALKSFESAQHSRDPDAAIAFLSPDFFMYTDGEPQGYDSVSQSIRASFKTFQHIEPGFRDIAIRPLSATSALATFRFRDSLVGTNGVIMRFTGATTLLWEYRGGRWLMTYGHADHRRVE